MLKSVVIHDIPMDHIAAMERWYFREHAPEINRRYGPWLPRHDSYLPVDAPVGARAYGWYNWRVTEGYWRDLPAPGPKGTFAFSTPPVWPRVATGFFPWQPTEDFLGSELMPGQRQMLRWYTLLRYPSGVSAPDGERWFLEDMAPALSACSGLYRAFSTRRHMGHVQLPGEWAPASHPPPETIAHSWDRLTEFWFETFTDWQNFIRDANASVPRPAWATMGAFPFVMSGVDFVSSFILERPNDEFARDARGYL